MPRMVSQSHAFETQSRTFGNAEMVLPRYIGAAGLGGALSIGQSNGSIMFNRAEDPGGSIVMFANSPTKGMTFDAQQVMSGIKGTNRV
jgi:hypothetical protein